MKVSLQLIPEQPAEQLLAAAQAADELGYYACYSADEIYHKDAWLLLTAAAGRTERIRLGPCVAPVYMRDPTKKTTFASVNGPRSTAPPRLSPRSGARTGVGSHPVTEGRPDAGPTNANRTGDGDFR